MAPQISWRPAPRAPGDLFCSSAQPPVLPKRPRSRLDGELLLRSSEGLPEDQPGGRAFSGAGPRGTGPTHGSPGLHTTSRLLHEDPEVRGAPTPRHWRSYPGEAGRPPSSRSLFPAREGGPGHPALGQQEPGRRRGRERGMNGRPGEECGRGTGWGGSAANPNSQRASAPCLIHKNFHLPLERSEPGQREAVHSAK